MPDHQHALERVNLILTGENSLWLDEFAGAIRQRTGARISRSEVVRAAIAMLRELHRASDTAWFGSLANCKSASELSALGVLAARVAANHTPANARTNTHVHTATDSEAEFSEVDAEAGAETEADAETADHEGKLQKGRRLFMEMEQ